MLSRLCGSTALTALHTAPCSIAANTWVAFGCDAIGSCAAIVFMAISFQFVTSLAEATVGTASATLRKEPRAEQVA